MNLIYILAIGAGTGFLLGDQSPRNIGLTLILVSFALILCKIADQLQKIAENDK